MAGDVEVPRSTGSVTYLQSISESLIIPLSFIIVKCDTVTKLNYSPTLDCETGGVNYACGKISESRN